MQFWALIPHRNLQEAEEISREVAVLLKDLPKPLAIQFYADVGAEHSLFKTSSRKALFELWQKEKNDTIVEALIRLDALEELNTIASEEGNDQAIKGLLSIALKTPGNKPKVISMLKELEKLETLNSLSKKIVTNAIQRLA